VCITSLFLLDLSIIVVPSFQEYRCETGGCINATLICDDQKDCPDGSDESSIICEHQLCPLDTFRCSFGGCVKLTAICDGFQDCIDGSDESVLLCGVQREGLRCPGIVTRRLNLFCHNDGDGVVDCGEPVKAGTVAKYSCK
jgi:Low-density lipoprotein receptor domain class A